MGCKGGVLGCVESVQQTCVWRVYWESAPFSRGAKPKAPRIAVPPLGAAILLVWVWPFILGSVLGWYKALAVRARIATPRDGDAGLGILGISNRSN